MIDWKRTVTVEWRTWCGNLLRESSEWISDGFSAFGPGCDPKRVAKLRSVASVYGPVEIDPFHPWESSPASIISIRDNDPEKLSRRPFLVCKWTMFVQTTDGRLTAGFNAQRVRCAMLVAKSSQLELTPQGWLVVGSSGLVAPMGDIIRDAEPPTIPVQDTPVP